MARKKDDDRLRGPRELKLQEQALIIRQKLDRARRKDAEEIGRRVWLANKEERQKNAELEKQVEELKQQLEDSNRKNEQLTSSLAWKDGWLEKIINDPVALKFSLQDGRKVMFADQVEKMLQMIVDGKVSDSIAKLFTNEQ